MSGHVPLPEGRPAGAWTERAPAAARLPGESRFGVLLLISVIVILYPFEYDTVRNNYSLGDAIVGPTALVFLVRALGRPMGWPRYLLQVVPLVLACIASCLINGFSPAFYFSTTSALVETVKLISAALWMCVIFWLLSEDFSRRFLQLAISSAVLATGFAISSLVVTVRETSDYRPTGPFDNDNLYASYLCFNVFLVLATGQALQELRRTGRALWAPIRWIASLITPVMIPLLILGMLATASRGALLGLVAGLAFSGNWLPRKLSPSRLAAILAGLTLLVALGGWYVQQHPLVLRRLQSTAEGSGPNIENRLELWQAGRTAFLTHPVLGVGYGQLRNYIELATGNNKPVHETFISMAAELGTVGLVAFVWLVAAVVWDTIPTHAQRYPDVSRALRGGIIGIITQGLFTNVQHSRALWIGFGVLAVLAAQRRSAGGSSHPSRGSRMENSLWNLTGRRASSVFAGGDDHGAP